ncbi:NAD(P)/FAD-dependent oxidoreductase [Haloplanus salinus]|mgnify:FL=1|jgi:NADH dehydrogenase|uniref:NAD(P)/FAD-dependent oxidoreductase n=1 Tax=Haloplanus salinus TaxID=1126245 RepID=A0A368NF55_9EURY|nr:FAD-dependent oxidoreductase [Haloplanus salinus]RCU48305.1 NAD(P)/FAD-dependent oxidoreductase [Haloplanus salinus]
MTAQVVVLGSGYAGAGAVKRFEEVSDGTAELTWISEHDYHLVLHESHRVIRDTSVAPKITIPVDEIKSPATTFRQGRVTGIDVEDRSVELDSGDAVDYDYLLVALGSATAFYGIEGLEEHAHTLKGLDDAREMHEDVAAAAADATRSDPAQVVIGGAGLSGIQSAGEVAAYRDEHRAPIDVTLVEGLDEVLPGNDPELQGALRRRLEEAGVDIMCGEFVSKVDADTIYVGGGEDEDPAELDYDVFLWTGGITGQGELEGAAVDKDDRSNRVYADRDFRTSDDRVFAIGDTALIEQGPEEFAPPTAQAAWQAAEVAGENLFRAANGQSLRTWTHDDKGTLISVGDEAVAHGVDVLPVDTFGGFGAETLKKFVAARWIADVSSIGRAVDAWSDM